MITVYELLKQLEHVSTNWIVKTKKKECRYCSYIGSSIETRREFHGLIDVGCSCTTQLIVEPPPFEAQSKVIGEL